MLRARIQHLFEQAVASLKGSGELPADLDIPVDISDPRNPEHGDFACNFALVASKAAGLPPRVIADKLLAKLFEHDEFASMEVAGPGFLNLRLRADVIAGYVDEIIALGHESLPNTTQERPLKINVEFVSVNPNGPITIGSGRGAAYGDTLARVLETVGHHVSREYYINDGVNSEQMRLFAESVKALAYGRELPENGYKGEYVADVAAEVKKNIQGDAEPDTLWFQQQSQEAMIERQRGDLALFGVKFDTWFSEQSLHDAGKVQEALSLLESRHVADREPYAMERQVEGKQEKVVRKEETPGPLWLRSTQFGDDKDRVLVRGDGRPAYIAADIAYLQDKLGTRAFDKSVLIVGPDHHGYIGRMEASNQALGFDKEHFQMIIFQVVRFLKEGRPAPMRKRDGNIYELRDLIHELGESVAPHLPEAERLQAGSDVTRFFYLMRSHDTHLDFDIDLATQSGDDNPVLYVQYAHARICSVLKKAAEAGFTYKPGANLGLIREPRELALIKKIMDLPEEVRRCSVDYAVNRLTTYAVELARTYHHFYDACRVLQPEQPDLTAARIAVCEASRVGLKAALAMLGVSAPERMDKPS